MDREVVVRQVASAGSGTATGEACPPCPDLAALQQAATSLLQTALLLQSGTKANLPEGVSSFWWMVLGWWEKTWCQPASVVFVSWASKLPWGGEKCFFLLNCFIFSPQIFGLVTIGWAVRLLLKSRAALLDSWIGRRLCPARAARAEAAADPVPVAPAENIIPPGEAAAALGGAAFRAAAGLVGGAGQVVWAAARAPVNFGQYVRGLVWGDAPNVYAGMV